MRYTVSEYSFSAGLAEPLRLIFVSDLHDCPNERLVARIRSLSPDAVLVGGDFIHNIERCGRGLDFLGFASQIAPTFVSIGNHDRHFGSSADDRIREAGAVPLDNDFTHFGGIVIGGLSSGYPSGPHGREKVTPPPNGRWLSRFCCEKGFKLLLCHHPEYYEETVKPFPIDLTVAGHAHGGQWRFFGRGIYAPGQGLFPKYTAGLYDGGRLLVGRGLGNPYPVPRIFNPPEIIVLNLV